jgi:hypothetical protein
MIGLDPMSKTNKLRGVSNFNAWKFKMENIFMRDNFWRFIDPNNINPIFSDVELEMFEQKKKKNYNHHCVVHKKLCIL